MPDKRQPRIIAYLKPSCGWSRGVRSVLQKYNLAYEDRDVMDDPFNFAEMVRKSGQTLQPTVEIDGHIIPGISGEELEQYLVSQGIVRPDDRPADAPTNAPCSDTEHATQNTWSDPMQIG